MNEHLQQQPLPEPTPRPGAVEQPWRRLPEQGRLAGVCAAIAQRQQVDVLLVRVAMVVLALSAGVGLALYAAAWLMVPPEGSDETMLEQWIPASREWSTQTKWLVTGLASLAVASPMLEAGLPIAPLLVAGGIYWYLKYEHSENNRPSPLTPTAAAPLAPMEPQLDPNSEFGRAVGTWQERLAAVDDPGHVARPVPLPQWTPTPHPMPLQQGTAGASVVRASRRRPSTWFGLGTLLVAGTAGGLATAYAPVAEGHGALLGLSVALGVVALSLVLGAFTRRPRFAVAAAWILAICLASSAATAGSTNFGETQLRYTTSAELPTEPLRIAASDGVIDFSRLDLDRNATVRLDARASDLRIVAPDDADLVLKYRLHASQLDVPRDVESVKGNQSGTVRFDTPSDRELVLEVEAWASDVEVR